MKRQTHLPKTLGKLIRPSALPVAALSWALAFGVPPVCAKASAQTQASQQAAVIKGKVIDQNGEPIIGATITIVGHSANQGAVSDLDGNFTLNANAGQKLKVSFLGYEPTTVTAKNGVVVKLQEQATSLKGVEVVAYGVQKKVTVTGAISSIKSDDLNRTPVSSVSQVLAGQLTGVSSVQYSGEPGNDAATIYVRGKGTWGDSNPLIQVDGVTVDAAYMNDIDPEEIESITVLKDASATAVFGVEGANGVVLITTKRGNEGKAKITASVSGSLLMPNRPVEQANSYEYATYHNMMRTYDGTTPNFTDEVVEKFRTQSDPIRFPSIRWTDYLMKKSTLQTKASLNISGGTKKVKYFIAVGMYTQGGLFKEFAQDYDAAYNYSRFNYRSNLDINVTNTTKLSVNIAGSVDNVSRPLIGSTDALMKQIYAASPFSSAGVVDDKLILTATDYSDLTLPFTGSNPMSSWYGKGYYKTGANRMAVNLALTQKLDFITKGLSFTIKGAYNSNYTVTKQGSASIPTYTPVVQYDDDGVKMVDDQGYPVLKYKQSGAFSRAKVSTSSGRSRNWYFDARLNWSRKFGLHSLSALLLYNQKKTYYPGGDYNLLPKGVLGLVGRVTYDWNNRYMAEFNIGYNGSENFARNHRYGTFPALSVGWNVSEEKFFEPVKKVVSFLKLRASWGLVGNGNIGSSYRFYYTPDLFSVNGNGPFFGVNLNSQVKASTEGLKHNAEVTWEKAFKQDYGIDVHFLDDRLSATYDYYMEHRNDLFCQDQTAPTVIGFTVPYANLGKTKSWGWELSLKWQDKVGKNFRYWAGVNLSYNQNEIIEKKETPQSNAYRMLKGHRIGADKTSGYKFFEYYNENTAANYEKTFGQPFPTQLISDLRPGDCTYVDLNGDGKIGDEDVTLEMGYTEDPEYTIGMNLGFTWKRLSVNTQWTGAWNVSRVLGGVFRYPFYTSQTYEQGGLLKYQVENSWTEENPDPNAKYPRVSLDHGKVNNYQNTDLYSVDAKYLRLKTLQVSYDFMFPFMKKIGLNTMQLSLSGYNLLTFTPFIWGDPETRVDDGPSYPLQRTYTMTLKLGF